MSAPDGVDAWLAKAESDELVLAEILTAKRVPWDAVCFHAQQQAEKLLKALVAAQGGEPPRTHDLVAVLGLCCAAGENLLELQGDCRSLTNFAVDVRYPDMAFQPSRTEGLAAVAAARRVREAVFNALRRLGRRGGWLSGDANLRDLV